MIFASSGCINKWQGSLVDKSPVMQAALLQQSRVQVPLTLLQRMASLHLHQAWQYQNWQCQLCLRGMHVIYPQLHNSTTQYIAVDLEAYLVYGLNCLSQDKSYTIYFILSIFQCLYLLYPVGTGIAMVQESYIPRILHHMGLYPPIPCTLCGWCPKASEQCALFWHILWVQRVQIPIFVKIGS